MTEATTTDALLRLPAVLAAVGMSRPSVYRMMKSGRFPQQIKLGTAAVGWLRSEVEQWIAGRVAQRGTSTVSTAA